MALVVLNRVAKSPQSGPAAAGAAVGAAAAAVAAEGAAADCGIISASVDVSTGTAAPAVGGLAVAAGAALGVRASAAIASSTRRRHSALCVPWFRSQRGHPGVLPYRSIMLFVTYDAFMGPPLASKITAGDWFGSGTACRSGS